MPAKKPKVQKVCKRCGKDFECWPSRADKTVYCSTTCARKPREERTCPKCGKSFVTPGPDGKEKLYCSKVCSNSVNGRNGSTHNDKLSQFIPEIVEAYQAGKTAPELASDYGVSTFAICRRLKQVGVQVRVGRNYKGWTEKTRQSMKGRNLGSKNPNYLDLPIEQILEMYQSGLSALHIAEKFGVSESVILSRVKTLGIELHQPGYSGFRRTKDGHLVQSALEEAVDNWLYEHNLAHEIQPRCPWPAKHSSYQRADFKVGSFYIEVWGVTGNEKYKAQRLKKIENYQALEVELIELYPRQIHKDDYSPLEKLLRL